MKFTVQTRGHYDFIDITGQIAQHVEASGISDGVAAIFVTGSTAALTTVEYEGGVLEDIKNVFENLAPENADYLHHKKWGDHNGAAHIKSAMLKTDLAITISDGKLDLGTWQQVVLVDFDEKAREREITVQLVEAKK